MAQSYDCYRDTCDPCFICQLGVERAARNRAGRMESPFAERAIDPHADWHWNFRSRQLRARHVYAAAIPSEYRLCDHGGRVRFGDAAWLCEPRAWRPWGLRCRHACCALAIRQRVRAGRIAAVPVTLLFIAVCNCADHPRFTRNMA